MKRLFSILVLFLTITGWSAPIGYVGTFTGNGAGLTNLQSTAGNVFTYGVSNYAPVTVSGAAIAAANGTYYVVTTNTGVGNAGFAEFTNSNGNQYSLLLNDPLIGVVPLWSIEDDANNPLYDNGYSQTIDGYWEDWNNQSLGPRVLLNFTTTTNQIAAPILARGTNSVVTVDGVGGNDATGFRGGLPFKTLQNGMKAFRPGDTLKIEAGNYEVGTYIWMPTNATVIAYGAVIHGTNGVKMAHPYGYFQMYGGTISNDWVLAPGTGSLCMEIPDCTNRCFLSGVNLFGVTDVINGTALKENFTISLINCVIGSWWDGITITQAANNTNTSFYAIGCRFWSLTNHAMSASSTLLQASVANGKIVGCTIEQGLGFTTGAGITVNSTGCTNEIGGTTISVNSGVPKVKQTLGTIVINGHPYADSDVSGVVTYQGYSVATGGLTWATNSTLPAVSTTVIKAWLSVTNDSGKIGKIPVYY